MTTAALIATQLELLAGDVLRELEGLPEDVLNQTVDVPEANSLFAIATHMMASGENWTLVVVGGRDIARDRDAEFVATGTFADLQARYDAWMRGMHEVLDEYPDSELGRETSLPAYRADLGVEMMTVELGLIHVIDHTAVHLGHIQVTKQFLLAGAL